jgi:hypothetical protein
MVRILLNNLVRYPRYSFNSATSTLIVQCIPTAVHESIQFCFTSAIAEAQADLPFPTRCFYVQNQQMNKFEGQYSGSVKIADLAVQITNSDGQLETKLVVEIGFSEKYADLVKDISLLLLEHQNLCRRFLQGALKTTTNLGTAKISPCRKIGHLLLAPSRRDVFNPAASSSFDLPSSFLSIKSTVSQFYLIVHLHILFSLNTLHLLFIKHTTGHYLYSIRLLIVVGQYLRLIPSLLYTEYPTCGVVIRLIPPSFYP